MGTQVPGSQGSFHTWAATPTPASAPPACTWGSFTPAAASASTALAPSAASWTTQASQPTPAPWESPTLAAGTPGPRFLRRADGVFIALSTGEAYWSLPVGETYVEDL